jgi:hypothetical protein
MVLPAWQQKLIHHLRSLPTPHLPDDTGMAFNGVVTTQYVLSLQKTLDLPSTVLHLHTAQLGSVVERAGYVRLRLSYRPPKAEATKLSGWMHPALARLAPDQLKAFLGQFPDLFVGKVPPPAWFMLEAEHLQPAVEELKLAPLLSPLDFNEEHG